MLNLSSKIQTIIIYALASSLVAVIASHAWVSLENRNLEVQKKYLTLDIEKIESAEKSCKKAFASFKEAKVKKTKVLQKYKNHTKGVSDEKIDDIRSFIDYASRVQ